MTHLRNGSNFHEFLIFATSRSLMRISLPRSLDRAYDGPLASADYSCDCDDPFARVAAIRCPCPAHRWRPQLAVYSWKKQSAAVEVAVEEVTFRFVGAAAGESVADPSRSPPDSKDYRGASSLTAPCFDCSIPFDHRADSVDMAACWPDCDGSVCSDASERPCHHPLDNGRACLSSCRNL